MLIELIFLSGALYCFYRLYDRNQWKDSDRKRIENEEPNREYPGTDQQYYISNSNSQTDPLNSVVPNYNFDGNIY